MFSVQDVWVRVRMIVWIPPGQSLGECLPLLVVLCSCLSVCNCVNCLVLQVAGDSNSSERYIRGDGGILSVCAQRSVSEKCCHSTKACHEEISAERRGVCSKKNHKMSLINRYNSTKNSDVNVPRVSNHWNPEKKV